MIDEIVDELELGPAARGASVLGAPSYDPRMMLKVLSARRPVELMVFRVW